MTAPLPDNALKVRVRNVLGIKQADLVLRDLVLICGINGAGKSSLLQATAAAAIGTANMRGQNGPKLRQRVLRDGTDAGSVVLAYAGGETRVLYPGGQVTTSGVPQTLGSALGIGTQALMSLQAPERTREMAARLQAHPTRADLDAWIKEKPEPVVQQDAIDLLWERIEASGWDAIHATAREHATRLKGRWEQVTRDHWGPKKAAIWCPSILVPGDVYNLAEAEEEVQRTGKRATALSMKVVAVRSNEADLRAKAEKVGALEAEVRRLQEQSQLYDQESERLIERREALPDATDASQFPACPHCQRAVQVTRAGATAPLALMKAPNALSGEALEQRRAERSVVLEAIERLGADIQRNAREMVEAQEALRTAQRAKADLDRLQTFSEVSQADIDQAGEDWRQAGHKRDAIRALIEAQAIYAEWAVSERMAEALAPDGVRASVMRQRLGAFNKRLGDIVDTANRTAKPGEPVTPGSRFGEVVVTDEFEARYDGRPYALISESERWRVDLVVTAALGQLEGARLIVVDRLDVLHAPARRGVLLMLKALGIPALIAMTAKQVEDAPDLRAAAVGTRHWIHNGILEGSA